jgi:2-methylcitrate dehydratase PrpD
MTLAERLAGFAAALRYETLPAPVVDSVTLRVLDTVGLALAGARAPFAAPLLTLAGAEPGAATVLGTGARTSAALAILVNGALAHGLDFDDTHAASITHASSVVVPVALALGETLDLDGRAAIVAAVAGYEAITRIGMAASGAFHDRGWHATAVCGAFAAALVAGRCHGLDTARLVDALGIAGSCASGVMEFLEDGSAVKRLHPGWAGHGGAIAAALARGGFGGPATVLEGRFGLYATFLGKAPDRAPFETLGHEWETLRIAFKPYPCCHYNHAYLDCALELRARDGVREDEIRAIECRVPAGEVPIVCEPAAVKARPRTTYEAQFSLPFSLAAAFVDGRVGVETYTPARLDDPRILGLARRIRYAIDAESRFPAAFPGAVRVELVDGRVLETRVDEPRGGPGRPLAREAIVEKFRANAGLALPPERVRALEHVVLDLPHLSAVGTLAELCRV